MPTRPQISNTPHNCGFAFVELLIVIGIGLVLLVFGLWVVTHANTQTQQNAYASTQATEMATLSSAASQYGRNQLSGLAVGARFDASPATLIANKLLAVNFATRFGSAGTSPLGQTYKAAGVKEPLTGAIEVMVWVDGAPRAAQLAYTGIPAGDAGLAQYAQSVNVALMQQNVSQTATVAANTSTASGGQAGFAIDVSTWVAVPAPAFTTPAILANFVQLGVSAAPAPIVTGGGGGMTSCSIIAPTASGVTACPTGQHSVATFPVCGSLNTYTNMPWPVYGTTAGIVTVGFRETRSKPTNAFISACYNGGIFGNRIVAPPAYCHYNVVPMDTMDTGIVQINGATIDEVPACGGQTWSYPCPTNPTSPYMCQVTNVNPGVKQFKANAINNLCCAD